MGRWRLRRIQVNYITHFTGNWALWMLLGSLAITPLRRLWSGLNWTIKFRRMIGLYAFFYASLHLLTYVLLFSGYDVPAAVAGLRAGHLMDPWMQLKKIWPTMLDDLKKRKFIQVGLAAWVILLVLAVTSPQRVLRAMGGKNWQRVHRLVYLAGALACIHYWWLVKTGRAYAVEGDGGAELVAADAGGLRGGEEGTDEGRGGWSRLMIDFRFFALSEGELRHSGCGES